jgi:transcription elongation factor Elf1
MPGNWGRLDCPSCGHTHPPPERASSECDAVIADLICPNCGQGWEVRVELWRYYGIQEELPSREQDR